MNDSERLGTSLWSGHREGSVLRIRGDVDVFTAEDIEERLVTEVLDGAVQVDLSEVEFFGLAGVRVLQAGADVARSRGAVREIQCPPAVMRLLEICGVEEDDRWRLSPLDLGGDGHGPEIGDGH